MRATAIKYHPVVIGIARQLHTDAKHLGQLRIQMPEGIADFDDSPSANRIGQRQG